MFGGICFHYFQAMLVPRTVYELMKSSCFCHPKARLCPELICVRFEMVADSKRIRKKNQINVKLIHSSLLDFTSIWELIMIKCALVESGIEVILEYSPYKPHMCKLQATSSRDYRGVVDVVTFKVWTGKYRFVS